MAFEVEVEVAENNYQPAVPKVGDIITCDGKKYVVTSVEFQETEDGEMEAVVSFEEYTQGVL